MKRLAKICLAALALLCLTGCGGGNKLKIENSPVSQEGVTVTLDKATAEKKRDPERYEYTLQGTIENTSDEGVMRVIYTFAFLDKNGEEFRSFGIPYDENEAIPPHTKIEFSHDDIKWGAQDVPATVVVGISSVATESELPPEKIPQKGEYLYQALADEKLANIEKEPPVELSFHIDQGGYGRTATLEKGEELDRAVELLCQIKIGEESDEWVTDNYNWIRLAWEDGTETYLSLNRRNLEYSVHSTPHVYTLEGLDGFWAYASEYLVEDGAEGGGDVD